ncbi:phosphonoacetaldehyde hydrolase, partial [Priestia megaterium]
MKKIKAVILDRAETMIDYGSIAQLEAFLEIFKRTKVEIT